MSNGYKQLVLAWALIAAQLFVVVIGHGRIMICHDEGGSTHVELIGEDSCGVNDAAPCGLGDDPDSLSTQRLCAETSCEDELYGLTYTLSSSRRIGQRVSTDFVPTNVIATLSSSMDTDSLIAMGQSTGLIDSVARSGCRLAIRTTVLVL